MCVYVLACMCPAVKIRFCLLIVLMCACAAVKMSFCLLIVFIALYPTTTCSTDLLLGFCLFVCLLFIIIAEIIIATNPLLHALNGRFVSC